jgi:hypothetical protein
VREIWVSLPFFRPLLSVSDTICITAAKAALIEKAHAQDSPTASTSEAPSLTLRASSSKPKTPANTPTNTSAIDRRATAKQVNADAKAAEKDAQSRLASALASQSQAVLIQSQALFLHQQAIEQLEQARLVEEESRRRLSSALAVERDQSRVASTSSTSSTQVGSNVVASQITLERTPDVNNTLPPPSPPLPSVAGQHRPIEDRLIEVSDSSDDSSDESEDEGPYISTLAPTHAAPTLAARTLASSTSTASTASKRPLPVYKDTDEEESEDDEEDSGDDYGGSHGEMSEWS